MKRIITALLTVATLTLFSMGTRAQQGPGLLISEVLANPAGTDSPLEYVELIATRTIDFSTTPYSVVFCNNGTATVNGWVEGGTKTYGFEITTGTVNAGDVVYVGGSGMAPTGTKLRVLDTGVDNGDEFGTPASAGVLGNGGTNCDGVAVFGAAIASLTSSTVPDDAIFFGTGVGSAEVNGGIDGYHLPVNDNYNGGKLSTSSFLGPDPSSGINVIATGTFNTFTGAFTVNRVWTTGTATDGSSTISLVSIAPPPVDVEFDLNNITFEENAGTASIDLVITNPNPLQASIDLEVGAISNAVLGTDYTLPATTITIPGNTSGNYSFSLTITDDNLVESDEYIVLSLTNGNNANPTGITKQFLYIRDDDNVAPTTTNQLVFQLLSSYQNGSNASNSAEIVAHDPSNQRLYVANSKGARLDILDFSNPSSITPINSIDITTYGNINSVAVLNGLVALAIEDGVNPQDSGKVVFLDQNGTFINSVKVGAMPDMITFNHAGDKIVVACEGEPSDDYLTDPNGKVCIVDISGGVATVNLSNVNFVELTSFNGQEAALIAQGIRIYGPGASAAQDIEPEYITILSDDQTAVVTCQENNAVLVIDINTGTILSLLPLGTKDHILLGNELDATDKTAAVNLSNFPLKGLILPDAIAHITIGGTEYIISANEGDSRDYSGFSEETRLSSLTLDPTAFPNALDLQNQYLAGRIKVTTTLGDIDNDNDYDEIYTFGTRSFSIWDASTGALVWDSGSDFERFLSTDPVYYQMFNASNGGTISVKDRSDDKGPEPEGVATAIIEGVPYAFIGLERIGGVMIYNLSNPLAPEFVGYHNNRDIATNGPDRGVEGIVYVEPTNSPNGSSLIILANEVSSSLTIYQVNTCSELVNAEIQSTGPTTVCQGTDVELFMPNNNNTDLNFQWTLNGNDISGETDSVYIANNSGSYGILVNSNTYACQDTADIVNVVINALPTVTANATATEVCAGENVTLSGSGAISYSWDNSVTDGVAFAPTGTLTYTVTGTDANNCSATDQITVTVNPLPSPVISASGLTMSTGSFTTYQWYLNGNAISGANSSSYTATQNGTYTVEVTDANGCSNTSAAFTINTVDVTEFSGEFSIYPNPVMNELTIVTNGFRADKVEILNLLGETVYSENLNLGENFNINTAAMQQGIYILRLSSQGKQVSTRFIKK